MDHLGRFLDERSRGRSTDSQTTEAGEPEAERAPPAEAVRCATAVRAAELASLEIFPAVGIDLHMVEKILAIRDLSEPLNLLSRSQAGHVIAFVFVEALDVTLDRIG